MSVMGFKRQAFYPHCTKTGVSHLLQPVALSTDHKRLVTDLFQDRSTHIKIQ